MKKGCFIVFDGGEGCGKSTHLRLIKERFGDSCVITREPGGTPFAEALRALLLSQDHKAIGSIEQFLAMWAARFNHVRELIVPAVAAGKLVVSDRFDSSTWAYQIAGHEEGFLRHAFEFLREMYLEAMVVPTLYIIFDVPVKVGLARARGRDEDTNHFDEREAAFHERVRAGFLEFAQEIGAYTDVYILNTDRPKEVVHAELVKVIEAHLKEQGCT